MRTCEASQVLFKIVHMMELKSLWSPLTILDTRGLESSSKNATPFKFIILVLGLVRLLKFNRFDFYIWLGFKTSSYLMDDFKYTFEFTLHT